MTLKIDIDQYEHVLAAQTLHLLHVAKDEIKGPKDELRKFIIFIIGGEVFAVEMAPVQEIIRLPDIVRVPLAPPSLKGLSNLRGKILPVVSLRHLIGFEEIEYGDSARAVVINVGQPLGFVVDCVANVVAVESHQIQAVDTIRGSIDADLILGLIKGVGGHAMIMVLDFEKLIKREFSHIAAIAKKSSLPGTPVGSHADNEMDIKANDELRLVSFYVSDQEYAFDLDDVQEIVQPPDTIIHVPHAQSHVMGVMTLRDRLLPLVSLGHLFGLPVKALNEKSRILVLIWVDAIVGVAVDGVSEVIRVAKSLVDPMPSLLANDDDMADITEICRLDNGERLIGIIPVHKLFNHSAIKDALNKVTDKDNKNVSASRVAMTEAGLDDDDEHVVVFRLDKEEFGVPISCVQEITRLPSELSQIPSAPTFIEGVVNLRGSVLPVIDLRLRLRMPKVERSNEQRILIFLIANLRTGFIVDQVAELLKISKSEIALSPPLSNSHGRLLTRTANINRQKRMVQLLDPSQLVDGEELKSLASIGC